MFLLFFFLFSVSFSSFFIFFFHRIFSFHCLLFKTGYLLFASILEGQDGRRREPTKVQKKTETAKINYFVIRKKCFNPFFPHFFYFFVNCLFLKFKTFPTRPISAPLHTLYLTALSVLSQLSVRSKLVATNPPLSLYSNFFILEFNAPLILNGFHFLPACHVGRSSHKYSLSFLFWQFML